MVALLLVTRSRFRSVDSLAAEGLALNNTDIPHQEGSQYIPMQVLTDERVDIRRKGIFLCKIRIMYTEMNVGSYGVSRPVRQIFPSLLAAALALVPRHCVLFLIMKIMKCAANL